MGERKCDARKRLFARMSSVQQQQRSKETGGEVERDGEKYSGEDRGWTNKWNSEIKIVEKNEMANTLPNEFGKGKSQRHCFAFSLEFLKDSDNLFHSSLTRPSQHYKSLHFTPIGRFLSIQENKQKSCTSLSLTKETKILCTDKALIIFTCQLSALHVKTGRASKRYGNPSLYSS